MVVEAYDSMKQEIQKCTVEFNVFLDVWYSFGYYYHQTFTLTQNPKS